VAYKRRTDGCAGSGQSLLELAIAVPIMLLIMLGTIDVGRLFFGYIEMTNAVREGAEYAAHQPAATDKIRSYVTRHAEDLPVASIAVTCSNGDCGTAVAGDRVTVEATWQFTPVTGQFLGAFFGLPRFDLRVKSTMRVL
jgi:Flp pilus assembly protein TadG